RVRAAHRARRTKRRRSQCGWAARPAAVVRRRRVRSPALSIARGDAVALTRELVRVDSRNPSLVPGGPGESVVAKTLATVLPDWGLRVDLQHAAPQRPNVIARAGKTGGRTLMFNGHLDVVGVEGMSHAPWDAFQREGRIYGRGSADMKAGVAAMCAA